MDQTPLPFALADTKEKMGGGRRSVCAAGPSGFDKKGQCTVQLAVFTDGNSQVSVEEKNSG